MGLISPEKQWFVYILECSDSSFYTGISNNIQKRVVTHNAGRGAKYTRSRLPVKLLYLEKSDTKSSALKREYAIKQLSKSNKLALICAKTNLFT